MAFDSIAPEAVLWVDDTRCGIVEQLLDLMGSAITPIGVGGPRHSGIDALAQRLGTAWLDDPRQLMVEHPAAYLLLATPHGIDDADVAMALHQGTNVLALEPACQSLAGFAELDRPQRGVDPTATNARGQLIHLPLMVQSAGLLAAADPQDAIGEPSVVSFSSTGPTDEGSAFARLMDAWITVLAFAPMPESIDAQLTGPLSAVPDDPRALTGAVTAHARLPEAGAAVITIADHTPRTPRRLGVIGGEGILEASPDAYTLRHLDGEGVDHLEPTGPPPGYADQLANQWRRLLDARAAPADRTTRREQDALACCLTCLLSARTGQPETPQRLVEMSRG